MIFDPACISCIVNQAYNSAKLFGDGDKSLQLRILKDVCEKTKFVNHDLAAPFFSRKIQEIIIEHTGELDPYKSIKKESIAKAEKYIPVLSSMIKNSQNKLEAAIRAAILGNIIDFGASPDFNLEHEIKNITETQIDTSTLSNFKNDLNKAKMILYIGDNYEEALFDKLLLTELLPKRIVFAVRSQAILNDITLAEAKNLNIDIICSVIESGSTIAGTDLNECTPEFLELYNTADLVISKGQGNYETLIDETRPIYFLFKVKCEVISKHCGLPVGKGTMLLSRNDCEEKKAINY